MLVMLHAVRATATCPGPDEPWGGDDEGTLTCDAAVSKCQQKAAKSVATMVGSILKCHARQAKSAMDGTPFDVRGVLQLAGQAARIFPEKAEGIEVGARAARLHFLHAAGWDNVPGTRIATYVIHYKDGTSAEMPVISGEDVSDWWQYPQRRFNGKQGKVVWTGRNPACRNLGATLKLYKSSWENPNPTVAIDRVDYRSQMTTSAPFLIAITAEGK